MSVQDRRCESSNTNSHSCSLLLIFYGDECGSSALGFWWKKIRQAAGLDDLSKSPPGGEHDLARTIEVKFAAGLPQITLSN